MQKEYRETKATYDNDAAWYAKNYTNPGFWNSEYERFMALVLRGARVLDVGCGPARDTKYLLDKGYDVVSMDYSSGMLSEARRICPSGIFIRSDMHHPGVGTCSFDALWVCASLHHAKKSDVGQVIDELGQTLKPGGVMFVTVKEGSGEEFKLYSNGSKRFFSYYTLEEIEDKLRAHGLNIIDGYYHRGNDNSDQRWICVFARKTGADGLR
jgi:SAM-dependent methyltransferase